MTYLFVVGSGSGQAGKRCCREDSETVFPGFYSCAELGNQKPAGADARHLRPAQDIHLSVCPSVCRSIDVFVPLFLPLSPSSGQTANKAEFMLALLLLLYSPLSWQFGLGMLTQPLIEFQTRRGSLFLIGSQRGVWKITRNFWVLLVPHHIHWVQSRFANQGHD